MSLCCRVSRLISLLKASQQSGVRAEALVQQWCGIGEEAVEMKGKQDEIGAARWPVEE